jgi:hypothetical protein
MKKVGHWIGKAFFYLIYPESKQAKRFTAPLHHGARSRYRAATLPLRMLVVAIEAVFSFLFWAMRSRTRDCKMGSCCPWERDKFSYDGLCSHNPLSESVRGEFELTAEDLIAIAADKRERHREDNQRNIDNQKRQKAEKVFHCTTCDFSARNRSDFAIHNDTPDTYTRRKWLRRA